MTAPAATTENTPAEVPEWRARLAEGWCPQTDHPRLDPTRVGPRARGHAWCPTCRVEWKLDTARTPEKLRLRIIDAAVAGRVASTIDPGFLDRIGEQAAADALDKTVRTARTEWQRITGGGR